MENLLPAGNLPSYTPKMNETMVIPSLMSSAPSFNNSVAEPSLTFARAAFIFVLTRFVALHTFCALLLHAVELLPRFATVALLCALHVSLAALSACRRLLLLTKTFELVAAI